MSHRSDWLQGPKTARRASADAGGQEVTKRWDQDIDPHPLDTSSPLLKQIPSYMGEGQNCKVHSYPANSS